MRVSIVLAVGAAGSEEDLEAFMELMRADFEHRAVQVAKDIMRGRVVILPSPEVIDDSEVSEPAGSSG